MKTAFRKAMEIGVDVVVKLDGDGQMDPTYIAPLVVALTDADFAKGNRLFDRQMLQRMPAARRIGLLSASPSGPFRSFRRAGEGTGPVRRHECLTGGRRRPSSAGGSALFR